MNIRIVAIDKMDADPELNFQSSYYIVHSEAQWIDEAGKSQVIEFRTSVPEEDLQDSFNEVRRCITENAYDVIKEEKIAQQLIGLEWSAPDRNHKHERILIA
jgi:hypothetical protein